MNNRRRSVVFAILGILAVFLASRVVNRQRYLATVLSARDLVPEYMPRVEVKTISDGYLNGYHLYSRPAPARRKGLLILWGGSEGSVNFVLASKLAAAGHEVLALYFFGKPGQCPSLSRVPLEHFSEVLDYAADHTKCSEPLTVIGASKGAELALLLPTYYPEIRNVVLYSPGQYVYQGLDRIARSSSWTWKGRDLPYIRFRHARPAAVLSILRAKLLNVPVPLRQIYESATARDPCSGEARIDVSQIAGKLLIFAGDDDRLWQSEHAARSLLSSRPYDTEVHVYPGAGHVFGPSECSIAGFELGGSPAANSAAAESSTAVLLRRLAKWHK